MLTSLIFFVHQNFEYQWSQLQNRNNKLMQDKDRKIREYYLQGRNATAKKGSKNRYHNDSQTPNSHSTSHNHYKYEKEIDYEEQQTSKKQPLTAKQMKMMIRCMQEYCNLNTRSCEAVSQKYQIAAQMFRQLQTNYQMIGNQREVRKNQRILQQLTPHSKLSCQICQDLGYPCDQYQRETLQNSLNEHIDSLQNKLLEVFRRRELLQKSLQAQQQNENRQLQLQNLKKVLKLQTDILSQLDSQTERRELTKMFGLKTKVSRQQEEQ